MMTQYSHDDDDLSSNGSKQGTSTESKGSEDTNLDGIKRQLTKGETTAVFRLRVTVILVLVVAAIGISLTVFRLTRQAEIDEFEIQYYGSAEKILESFNQIFVEMGAVSGLGVAATAHSADHGANWPYITLSSFQERAGNARALSQALYVSISPLVGRQQLEQWDEYVMSDENSWMDEGFALQENLGINDFESPVNIARNALTDRKVDPPHRNNRDGPSLDIGSGPYLLRWQTSPVLKSNMVNQDVYQEEFGGEHARACLLTQSAVLGRFAVAPPGNASHEDLTTAFFATLLSMEAREPVSYQGDPMAFLHIPVFHSFDRAKRQTVAVMTSVIHWRAYLRFLLPSNVNGITVVLDNECDGSYTYEIHGDEADFLGEGDKHDPSFEEYEESGQFTLETLKDGSEAGIPLNQEGCPYRLRLYPTERLFKSFVTMSPVIVTASVALVFGFSVLLFFAYDALVERRQRLILAKATQSTAIVSSLFPKNVRDRLLQADTETAKARKSSVSYAPSHGLKTFLNGNGNQGNHDNDSQPIADLFPYCTVFFGDIAGFTAWSSTREPAQVFVLLQAVYQQFDNLAKRRQVFKVETIGDSYVAVTGLPDPQANHATIMARFAWECLLKMNEITKELEVTLGPDTGDLTMRFGLHSGPVTAGVLRGERARFQLFGDTVNTASRMESTGARNKIHVSEATANCLRDAGKSHWLQQREDAVKAKGKGVLRTYWVNPGAKVDDTCSSTSDGDQHHVVVSSSPTMSQPDSRTGRLVDWMVDLFLEHIKKIVAVRKISLQSRSLTNNDDRVTYVAPEGMTCLDETVEVMQMPKFNAETTATAAFGSHDDEVVSSEIVSQLREYVTLVASTYRDNPFHNFQHACHVTMSVNKLLKRIVTPDLGEEMEFAHNHALASHLHDFSHGITSDPMTLFAITFSALIHDADHRGCSNTALIKEEPEMAKLYRNKSVAEQNSLDICWEILMLDQFFELRRFIFGDQKGLLRFRQLIVNIVLATDIFDKELNDLRKQRWARAFSANQPGQDVTDMRATIVIEHIIQASDVSHTMQHWHVYQKWNKFLFEEMYLAYQAGHLPADPATFWYKGELGFFDNYIIPLAKKLKECNVFGVSSDEYLNYAVLNRAEWEQRGHEIVIGFVADLGIERKV